jgi:hypothetical protein
MHQRPLPAGVVIERVRDRVQPAEERGDEAILGQVGDQLVV